MKRKLALFVGVVLGTGLIWMLFSGWSKPGPAEAFSPRSAVSHNEKMPASLPAAALPPYRADAMDPSEAALANADLLSERWMSADGDGEWIRETLVTSVIQPKPLRVVERWFFDGARADWRLRKRELFVADQVIVQATAETSKESLEQALTHEGMTLAQHLGESLYTVQLATADLDAVPQALERLGQMKKWVLIAEADGVGFGSGVPNDPSFSSQWGLHNTGQSGGTPGADINAIKLWETIATAPDVVVAVLDSGLNFSHPDLQNIAWNNPGEIAGDGIDNDGNGRIDDVLGWDFVNNDNDPTDDHSHGTHVTGILCANRDNGVGVAGVLDEVKILSCKILNASNSGLTSHLIAATIYARQLGVPIMNLSLQNYPFNSSLNSEFTQCMNAGILLCICAGNQGTNNDDTPNYPSSYSQANIIAVGNLMRTDVRSTNSNFGLVSVDLFAPGTTILAPVLGTDYGNKTGTSMSTPFVTAVAAVIKQLNPDWQHAEIKNSILLSVTLRPAYSGICVTGGRLNALAAVAHAVKQEPLADLDGDGFPNFFEYAVGSRMDDRSEQPQLLFSAHAGAFQLTLPHAGRDGVMIRLERFTNSGVWTDGGLTDLSSSGQKAGSIPLDGSAGRLLRFVIEAPP